ncbi:polysaccharide deacetylase family protein [Methylobacterium frigidaeris]|uniref:polysaccharide deacetylase family protein n=2 Tax=Methylobacterium frigidaeris TaxID=2038277 RepID=UPI001EDEFBD8|nr:polysaccharide deacetylase family protein [Methylobacterium frigidaeris]
MEHDRDFRGYGGHPPAIAWPRGARLAVSVVVNVEEGAELSLGMGDERNESVYEVVEEVVGSRDLCMESHFEYGTRAGWPRIRALLSAYGVSATLNANGRAVALSPWLAREAAADGHEVAAHGWRWERHAGMGETEERDTIARAVAAIRDATGRAPVGWHTRSATSVNTRRLLLDQGGFLYDSNAYNDDLPYLVPGRGDRPHVVLPYAFDTNDMRFQRGGGFVFGDDFARYCIDAFDRLYAEGGNAPRMLSVGLHLRIIGRPGRIGGLERFLAHAAAREGTWFARRDAIAAHWLREAAGFEGSDAAEGCA